MRLIDADRLILEYDCYEREWLRIRADKIDTVTVEAIPIEYIEKFKKKVRHIAPAKAVIEWLLEEWEKENEKG